MAEYKNPYDKYIKNNYYNKPRPNDDLWSDYHRVPKKKVVVSSAGGKKKPDNHNIEPELSNWLKIVQVWNDFKGQDYDDVADALYDIVHELICTEETEEILMELNQTKKVENK